MSKMIALLCIVAVSLAACAPAGPSSAEATLIALSVQLTVAAQSTEAPTTIATETVPTPTATVAPVLPTDVPTETEAPEPAEEAEEAFEVPDWPIFRQGDEAPRSSLFSICCALTATTSLSTASTARRPAPKCATSSWPRASVPTALLARSRGPRSSRASRSTRATAAKPSALCKSCCARSSGTRV